MKTYLKTLWRAIRNRPMITVNIRDKVTLRTALDVIYHSTFECRIDILLDNVTDYSMKGYTFPTHPHGRQVKIQGKRNSVLTY